LLGTSALVQQNRCSPIPAGIGIPATFSSTIYLLLAAVRRLAYEAVYTGLLSPELLAGIPRVKGAKRIEARLGNWLSAEQVKALVRTPDVGTMLGKRDHAIISMLISCGLRRSETADLNIEDIRQRDER